MKHILLIDPLEKLVIKKDSTLLFALTLKKRGMDVVLLFEKDFFCSNEQNVQMKVYDFQGELEGDGPYLSSFELKDSMMITPGNGDVFHMRLDPPFDARYMRVLWMLKMWKTKGCEVLNSPEGIFIHNEKLYAYEQENSLQSYVGASSESFLSFAKKMKESGVEDLILKPLDLYQGLGVEKISLNIDLREKFESKVKECGAVVAQPFVKEVTSGEIRSIYFKGKELGTILKVPPKGEFLANIAQGATYSSVELNDTQRAECERITSELMEHNVPWVAFDILGDYVSEVNITCPGLLVEVSKAMGRNLAEDIIDLM